MHPQSGFETLETLRSGGRVHVIGAGPVGLLMTALFQGMNGLSVQLYEKRREYTRTRMVRLASYLVADSVEGYAPTTPMETPSRPSSIPRSWQRASRRQSIPSDLMALLRQWRRGFCPLNKIERSLSDLIDARGSNPVERTAAAMTAEDAIAMLEPGDVLIDCTGSGRCFEITWHPTLATWTEARTR